MKLRCVPSIVIVTGNVGMNRNSWSSYLKCTEVCAWKEMSLSVTHQKKWSITTGGRAERAGSGWLLQWDDCCAEENGGQAILDRSYVFEGSLEKILRSLQETWSDWWGPGRKGKTKAQPSLAMLRVMALISWLVENPWKVIPDRLRYVSIRLKCLFKDLGSSKTESCRENTKLCRTFAIFRYLVSYVANPTTAILLFAVFMSSSLSWLCSMFVAFPGRNNPLSVSPTSQGLPPNVRKCSEFHITQVYLQGLHPHHTSPSFDNWV